MEWLARMGYVRKSMKVGVGSSSQAFCEFTFDVQELVQRIWSAVDAKIKIIG